MALYLDKLELEVVHRILHAEWEKYTDDPAHDRLHNTNIFYAVGNDVFNQILNKVSEELETYSE